MVCHASRADSDVKLDCQEVFDTRVAAANITSGLQLQSGLHWRVGLPCVYFLELHLERSTVTG